VAPCGRTEVPASDSISSRIRQEVSGRLLNRRTGIQVFVQEMIKAGATWHSRAEIEMVMRDVEKQKDAKGRHYRCKWNTKSNYTKYKNARLQSLRHPKAFGKHLPILEEHPEHKKYRLRQEFIDFAQEKKIFVPLT
jgi:hypothetical protein